MSFTLYDWQKKTNNPLTVLSFKAIATTSELFSKVPFVPKGGESLEYTREKSLGSFGFINQSTQTISESSASDERVSVPKRVAGGDFYLDNFANEEAAQNEEVYQIGKKMKAAGRLLADKIVNGGNVTGFAMSDAFQAGAYVTAATAGPWVDSQRYGAGLIRYTNTGTKIAFQAPGDTNFGPDVVAASNGSYTLYSDNPSKYITVTLTVAHATADSVRMITFTSSNDEFDGLKKIVSPSMVIPSVGASGDAISFNKMDALYDSVKVRENLAYIMNASVRRKYLDLVRALGGVPATTVMDGGLLVPTHNGIPILVDDNVLSNETKTVSTLSSIYLASLNPEEGLYMGATGGASFDVDADPRATAVLGFRVRDIGQIEGKSRSGRRIEWYGALALGSNLALARASEIQTT